MPIYHVQHKIKVLLSNNANISFDIPEEAHTFTVEGLTFRPWNRNPHEYWKAGEWLVEADIDASSLGDVLKSYSLKMSRVVPRIAFVGQAYINDRKGPIFIKRDDKDFGWLKSIISQEPAPLDFMDEEKEALDSLLNNEGVPDAFYYYWNDSVNTTSYTGKLLLMFGAIDSLATRGQRKKRRNEILGQELANEIYADSTGLRNRLTHGEYLNTSDDNNYVELVHTAVLDYFNKSIIGKDVLELNIVGPQRHFEENYAGAQFFIKQSESSTPLNLHSLVEDIEKNEGIPRSYEIIFDNEKLEGY